MGQVWDLYIDESGAFDDPMQSGKGSLVGGLLVAHPLLSNERANKLLPEHVHCCETPEEAHERLSILETLVQDGARLIIFDNLEKMYVVNGDTTYLNILTEGLVKLLADLYRENADREVHICIATRKAMDADHGIILQKEYNIRLKEKLELARIRDNVPICPYQIEFQNAENYRMLDFADIVCNTYLTRNGRKKFTDEDRVRIKALYNPSCIYPVFESAAIRYAKQLLAEDRLAEAAGQLCFTNMPVQYSKCRQEILEKMVKQQDADRDVVFSHMALLISKFEFNRRYDDGIRFALRYIEQFLQPLQGRISDAQVGYRLFDTYFYILTMYDHLGNTSECKRYLEYCRANIRYVNRSWEHIAYYFRFCIREMNVLMGQFDFDAVLTQSKKLIDLLQETKELFQLIGHDEENEAENAVAGSELLGKAWGVRLEALINLLPDHPELADEAIAASDHALEEFTSGDDLSRQYQYRCMLMVQLHKPEDALACLTQMLPTNAAEDNLFTRMMAWIYRDANHPNAFALWHYTDVMVLLAQKNDQRADSMFKALNACSSFITTIKNDTYRYHPWQLILWNLSQWYWMHGNQTAADTYANNAVKLCSKEPQNITWRTFAINILADCWLRALEAGNVSSIAQAWLNKYNDIMKNAPQTICDYFAISGSQPTKPELMRMRCIYLK